MSAAAGGRRLELCASHLFIWPIFVDIVKKKPKFPFPLLAITVAAASHKLPIFLSSAALQTLLKTNQSFTILLAVALLCRIINGINVQDDIQPSINRASNDSH